MTAIRVLAQLSLAREDGWTEFFSSVVDTGAPISMFPRDVWRDARYTPIGRVRAGGIVQREDCRIPAILARIPCLVSDGVQTIGPLEIHAYLAESDRAPCLLGMAGLIESSTLTIRATADQAFMRAR